MQEFISRINWVDVLILIICARICYVSWHIGVGKQVLPLIFLILILLLSLHYYDKVALSWINVFGMAESMSNFISFLILVIIPSLVGQHLNKFWMKHSAEQRDLPLFERIGGLILGLIRSSIVAGFIIVSLILTPVNSVVYAVEKGSYLSKFFLKSNLNIYCAIVNIFTETEKKDVASMTESLYKDKDYLIGLFEFGTGAGSGESE